MKKLISLLLALSMALSLVSCGNSSSSTEQDAADASTPAADTADASTSAEPAADGEQIELTVFAAASMTETLDEIAGLYEEANPNVTLCFTYDSSGTLKTQIQEGADCDLFISAGQLQMNQLDAADTTGSNEENLDFVLSDSRIDLLENKVVLAVPDPEAENAVTSFDDMAQRLADGSILLAMGNADVPVGQYTQKILAYYDLNEEDLASAGAITYGTNVKEVTTQVSEGSVDCGVIYCTDAFSAGLDIIDYATAEMCGQIIYPAAVLNVSAHPDEAQAFLDYLQTEECTAIFEKVGFSAVE